MLKLFQLWSPGTLLEGLLCPFENFEIVQAHFIFYLSQCRNPPLVYRALTSFTGEWYLESKIWVLRCAHCYWGVIGSRLSQQTARVCMYVCIYSNRCKHTFISVSTYLYISLYFLKWVYTDTSYSNQTLILEGLIYISTCCFISHALYLNFS